MTARTALWISLGANLALVAALSWHLASSESRRLDRMFIAEPLASGSSPLAGAPSSKTSPTSASAATGTPADWIACLRTAGVPDAIVAATAVADFDRRWTREQLRLQQRFTRGEIDEATLLRHSDRRDEEREKALHALLGPETFSTWHRERLLHDFERSGIALSPTEGDAVYRARNRQLEQLRQLQHARADGLLDEAEFAENAAIAQHLAERQVAAVVGAERHAALHDGEADNLGALRRQLRAAGIAESQQPAVIQAHQRWLEQRSSLDRDFAAGRISSTEHDRLTAAILATRTESQNAVLGVDGFAAFTQAGDPRHATLAQFAGAWGLQEREVAEISALLRTFDARLRERRSALPTGTAEAEAASRALNQEAETALRATLGPVRFVRMQRTGVLQLLD